MGYTMMARVRGGSPAALARTAASMMGTKKQSDLPEPVPVVTTKLSLAAAFAAAWVWWRCRVIGTPSTRKIAAVLVCRSPLLASASTRAPGSK